MPIEIERKFRPSNDAWRAHVADEGRSIRQFYLAIRDGFSCRVRIRDGTDAVLTMKTGTGLSRGEYEIAIPLDHARELEAARLGQVIEKRRHRVGLGADGLTAEVDVFAGALAPLVLVEVELPRADARFAPPDWLGLEVTGDPAYLNARLALAGAPPPRPPSGGDPV